MLKLFLILSFFLNSTSDGLVFDKSNKRNVVSVSATGFGCYAWAKAVDYKLITHEKALGRINSAFDKILSFNKNNKGWFYLFTDVNGNPLYDKHISSIDTALFYSCIELAAKKLNDRDLIEKIAREKKGIDIDFMLNESGYFSHGFVWQNGIPQKLLCEWDNLSEGIILYRLFNIRYVPKKVDYSLPLFVYYYPLCFYKEPEMINSLERAIDYQLKNAGVIGLTACDDPLTGLYSIMKLDVVSPLSALSCMPFFPARCKPVLEQMKVSGLTPSMTRDGKFISRTRIMIDDGACLILISENKGL